MRFPYPIVLVHGMQGAWLKNQYQVDYQDEIYWTGVLTKNFEKLHLSTTDSTVDADIEKFIFPHQALPLLYESLVAELRAEITPHTYMFTYDWRKDIRLAAEQLETFVATVMKKVNVHALPDDPVADRVVLIGHSMGGLVIKWYVERILGGDAARKVEKIISIGTPYKGSLKAVEALLPGARNFFGLEMQQAMRKAARTLPGLYQLLPTWREALVEKGTGRPVDIFRAENWQKNLVDKMLFVYGPAFFQNMLDDARDFTDVMQKAYSEPLLSRFFCIWGKGSETLRQLTVDRENENHFNFRGAKIDKNGDGTVHSLSSQVDAASRFMASHHDLTDRLGGQHAQMPNYGEVQDYILRLLKTSSHAESFSSLR